MSGTRQTAPVAPPVEAAELGPQRRRFDFWTFPVTVVSCHIALAIAVAADTGFGVDGLMEGPQVGRGEVWRLVTSAFVHFELWHIAFNLYWLWIFGALVECQFGSLRTAALIIVLAFASGAYDYGFASGGIGLSGVVYGLFGLLWVLSMRDVRFAGALPQSTLRTFVVWFFVCIALTEFGILNVANVAHGAGCVAGMLIGFAITEPRWRMPIVGGSAALLAFGLWSATLGRAAVNLSSTLGYDEGRLGYEALLAHRDEEAVGWLLEATRLRPGEAANWSNLGVGYARLGKAAEEEAALAHADRLKDVASPTK